MAADGRDVWVRDEAVLVSDADGGALFWRGILVMSAADIRAQSLARRIDDPELRREADELREVIRESVERMRHLLFELRPPALDQEGLVAVLRAYAGDEDPTVEIVDRLRYEPPPEVRATVFRIAHEAIANARKHTAASRISVSLAEEHGGLSFTVSDDGKGFDVVMPASRERGHIGLLTMVERAELAGGRCSIESAPGRGTTVSAWLPLVTAAAAGA